MRLGSYTFPLIRDKISLRIRGRTKQTPIHPYIYTYIHINIKQKNSQYMAIYKTAEAIKSLVFFSAALKLKFLGSSLISAIYCMVLEK